jgi:hypothetical protein
VFRGLPGTYRVTGRGSGHPRQKIWALWAKRGNAPATRGWCASHMGRTKEEKERGEGKGKGGLGFPLPSLSHPLSFPLRQTWQGGAAKGRSPSRVRTYLGRPLASPLSLPHIYMWEGGRLSQPEHCLSRVRRPHPPFTPPVIFS